RSLQRLHRVSQPHAGAWVTAVPSDEDGFQTILRPKNFRTAAAYRLGVVVLKGDIPCPMCTQTIDKLGDHATCCSKAGDLIVRHNNLRNLVDRIAQDGQLSPVMEKKGILGPTSGRHPGDVTFRLWTRVRASQSTSQSLARSLRGTFDWKTPARTMRRSRSTQSTMPTSKTLTTSSLPLSSKPLAQSTRKALASCHKSFALPPVA